MDNFNPFDFLKDRGLFNALQTMEKLQQTPRLKSYIDSLLGPNFWAQVMENDHYDFHKMEVFQTSDEVIVMAEIPALESESDVRISLKGLTLLLEAIVPVQNMDDQSDRVFLNRQMNNQSSRKLSRRINLPYPVKTFGAKAQYKNGVLEIRLPKELLADDSHIEVQFL